MFYKIYFVMCTFIIGELFRHANNDSRFDTSQLDLHHFFIITIHFYIISSNAVSCVYVELKSIFPYSKIHTYENRHLVLLVLHQIKY